MHSGCDIPVTSFPLVVASDRTDQKGKVKCERERLWGRLLCTCRGAVGIPGTRLAQAFSFPNRVCVCVCVCVQRPHLFPGNRNVDRRLMGRRGRGSRTEGRKREGPAQRPCLWPT